jgi:cytochrome c peroxidase
MTSRRVVVVAFLLLTLSVRGAVSAESRFNRAEEREQNSTLSFVAQLGRKIFFDPSLSATGRQSCASCHSPSHAYGPPNGDSVQAGGVEMRRSGVRAVPSLRYLEHNPAFSIGPTGSIPDNDALVGIPILPLNVLAAPVMPKNPAAPQAEASVPQGGLDWDGRADSLQDQARGPFLDPNEMANGSSAELLAKIQKTAYAEDFKVIFGADIFRHPDLALSEALFALARFQIEDPSFHPYDSKYDQYLSGQVSLSDREMHGLRLFDDPKKGNCAACHIETISKDGIFRPAFTDYQFVALGVPRNREIPANRDSRYYDLGLCGPFRKNYDNAAYCGFFKTPTLRNTATRRAFFHNGVFHSLDDVLHFYVEREIKPEKWYPRGRDGSVNKYDDLPGVHRANVDGIDAPFDRKPGDLPALSDSEIDDVISFLKTLNDGYRR